MRRFKLITLAIVIAASSTARIYAQTTLAPLPLFINGGGSVSPLTNGELLEVGQTYNMVATPHAGFVFDSWELVDVFTLTSTIIDTISWPGHIVTNVDVSVTVSPLPIYTNEPSLSFIMQPVDLLHDTNGNTLTMSRGWQANFGPVVLNIQVNGAAVILTWTNSSFGLQSAPALSGVYTNILGAVSPYTNNISATGQYFRLISS